MVIHILGSGCPNCRKLEAHAREAVKNLGLEAEIVKIQDMDAIMDMGVMITPGLAIDGVVKKAGKVPSVTEIEEILRGQAL